MTSIGETLRRERLRRNLDLDKISRETKISARMLEAIEAEQFGKLPGGVFTKSFVKQYARYLELDEAELVAELERALEPSVPSFETARHFEPVPEVKSPKSEIHVPRVESWEGIGESRFRLSSWLVAAGGVVAVMLLCSGVYTWWQRTRVQTAAAVEHPAVSAPVQSPAQPTAPVPVATTPDAGQPNQTPAVPLPAQPNTEQAATPSAQDAPPASPPIKPSAEIESAPDPNAAVKVSLNATEATWVRVERDGKFIYSGVIQPNESRSISANESVKVRLGNAGGIAITLNGQDLGTAGPKGEVRTVQLTSGGLKIVPPAPKPPPAALADPL